MGIQELKYEGNPKNKKKRTYPLQRPSRNSKPYLGRKSKLAMDRNEKKVKERKKIKK
jgi:hypothetical protein